jgi:predicted MFS family arabinose efflux permease
MTLAMWLVGTGTVVTVLAPTAIVATLGLVVWGLGLSVVFPQLYATAARLPGTSAGAGLGWMLLGQRFGAMLTSVLMGAVSQWQDLRVAFASVCGAALVLLLVSLRTASSAARPLAASTAASSAPPPAR